MEQSGELVLIGGRLCLDFCNTVDERLGAHPHDLLSHNRYRALIRWGAMADALNDTQVEQLRAFAEEQSAYADDIFEMAIGLRELVYRLFMARINGEALPESEVAALDRAWHSIQQERQLSLTDAGQGIIDAWRNPLAPEILVWEITQSAVESLMHDDPARIRQCPGCGWLFYDQSKNNRRTWCDMRFCGNRAKNKRFHDRRRNS